MLKTTPFHLRTAPLVLGQTWRRWAGYAVASCYDWHHEREYWAIRNAAALIDVSPLYKYAIAGPDSARLLDRVVTRRVADADLGQVQYTSWCDAQGKVIDDGTVTRLAEDVFRLTSAEPNLRWLHMNASGLQVDCRDVSEDLAALAVQGPSSRMILSEAAEQPIEALKYFRVMATRIAGVDIQISRTGYTGDLGYELWVPASEAVRVWDALAAVASGYGLTPAGIWALDLARIEAGLLMLDVDYRSAHHALTGDQTSSPFELSLDWSVALDKGPFNGHRALRAEKESGPQWRFVGVEVEWDSLEAAYSEANLAPSLPTIAWRASIPIYLHGAQIGYASSGCWSPLLKKYIALAHVRAPHFAPGTQVDIEITVEHERKRAHGWIRKLPFFDPPRKRNLP